MKRLVFVLCLYVVITAGTDDFVEKLADVLSMTRTDVQICSSKANINITDLMRMDQLVNENVETAAINKSALKVGCLFACLLQKKGLMIGPNMDVEKFKEDIKNKDFITTTRHLIALDTCVDRVKGKTDECEVVLTWFLCMIAERKRYQMSQNMR